MKRHHSRENKEFNPETLALGLGYDSKFSEGAIKPPIFLTSTFQFESAEDGKRFFELAYGLDEKRPGEAEPGLIYSRLNNPNLQIFEERIAAWDRTEQGAVFSSGMSAIATTCLALLSPGDHVISSAPVYGGTHYLFEVVLPRFGITVSQVTGGTDTPELMREVAEAVGPEKVKMLYVESPANPSNVLIDIKAVADLAKTLERDGKRPVFAVDNTFLGPVFQRPAALGADLVIYSATKFIGGHSDLVAGVVTGPADLMKTVMMMRTVMGTMAGPFAGWLLLRSLETVSIRMRRQMKNARKLAEILAEHPRVIKVAYPELLQEGDPQYDIYRRCCTGPGSLIAFEVEGGEEAAFKILNRFEVARLAVSLGGTESLVEHPASMTHADVSPEEQQEFGIKSGLIRMSVGIEHLSDLQRDLVHALELD